MPVPYRDVDDVDELGAAAFLKIVSAPGSPEYYAALFLVNARGEPLEFTYNRLTVPQSFLWRPGDLRRFAERRLVISLFSACPLAPAVLLCSAREVAPDLFTREVEVGVPVGRIAPASETVPYSTDEVAEPLDAPEPTNLFWLRGPPPEDAPARQLVRELIRRSLILDPFERAAKGLTEVYGLSASPTT